MRDNKRREAFHPEMKTEQSRNDSKTSRETILQAAEEDRLVSRGQKRNTSDPLPPFRNESQGRSEDEEPREK